MGTRRPEPGMKCAGVLDGSNIPSLNTKLRVMGLTDNDRHELLKFASTLSRPANEKGGDHG